MDIMEKLGYFINRGHKAHKEGDMLMWHYCLHQCRNCYVELGIWADESRLL